MKPPNNLIVSPAPHLFTKENTRGMMLDVVIALLPALVAAVVLFGFRALLVTAVSVVSCVLSEFLICKLFKRENPIGDLSAVVTGLLLAFCLPPTLPIWMVVFGSVASIVVVKQFFGGIGQNFANPAIVGRILLMMSFPAQTSAWTNPFDWMAGGAAAVSAATSAATSATTHATTAASDAVTAATTLGQLGGALEKGATSAAALEQQGLPSLLDMFLGQRAGSLGEVCIAALLLGGLYLLARRVISPLLPLCFLGSAAVVSLIASGGSFTFLLYDLMSGGLVLGALFMATDYATSPMYRWGKVIFGVGCGLLTMLIRLFANMPEGVSFAILLMNLLVPHIEKLTIPKPLAHRKEMSL